MSSTAESKRDEERLRWPAAINCDDLDQLRDLLKRPYGKPHVRHVTLQGKRCGNNLGTVLGEHMRKNLKSLESINIAGNCLGPQGVERLARGIRVTRTLEHLDIGDNGVGVRGLGFVCEALESNKTIKALLLSNIKLGSVDGCIDRFADALARRCLLQVLDLSRNNLQAEDAIRLAAGLGGSVLQQKSNDGGNGKPVRLRQLNLSFNPIGPAGVTAIVSSAAGTTLSCLHLRRTGANTASTISIASLLAAPRCSLATLDLAENPNLAHAGVAAVATAAARNTSLTDLRLGSNGLLGNPAPHGASKESVDVSDGAPDPTVDAAADDDVPTSAFRALSLMLRNNKHLERLVLAGGGEVNCEAAAVLALGLERNQTLTHLNLEGNLIGDEGLAHVADALEDNGKVALQHLCLGRNRFGNEGLQRLAETLEVSNESVSTLILSGNRIGPPGLEALASALKTNQGLEMLDIRDCVKDDAAIRAFGAAVLRSVIYNPRPRLKELPGVDLGSVAELCNLPESVHRGPNDLVLSVAGDMEL